MKQDNWHQHIESTPEVFRGKPRIAGTRIAVSLVLGVLGGRLYARTMQAEYPDILREQIAACLEYARELSGSEIVST